MLDRKLGFTEQQRRNALAFKEDSILLAIPNQQGLLPRRFPTTIANFFTMKTNDCKFYLERW